MTFLFFKINIYLFMAALGLSCSAWDLHCGMWDLSLQGAGFFVGEHGLLSSCGTWAL